MLDFPDYRTHPAYSFEHSRGDVALETLRFVPALVRSTLTLLRARPFLPDYDRPAKNHLAARFNDMGHVRWTMPNEGLEALRRATRDVVTPWAVQHRAIPPAERTMFNALMG